MKSLLLSSAGLALFATAALADPVKMSVMSDSQMDSVTAGIACPTSFGSGNCNGNFNWGNNNGNDNGNTNDHPSQIVDFNGNNNGNFNGFSAAHPYSNNGNFNGNNNGGSGNGNGNGNSNNNT